MESKELDSRQKPAGMTEKEFFRAPLNKKICLIRMNYAIIIAKLVKNLILKEGGDFMKSVVSVNLPEKMSSELNKVAKDTGLSKAEIIKEALNVYLWELRFKKAQKRLTAKARLLGIVTDEDVFKAVS